MAFDYGYSLSDPNIVRFLGFEREPVPHIVMERLVGRDLRAVLREQGRLELTRAVDLVRAACSGLAAAHGAQLVHRDLKPENLFVIDSNGDERVKILDFGVAKLRWVSNSTEEGGLLGTLRYMAPEQVRSGADCDQRTDVYSLAAILYECLTGRAPFRDRNPHRLLYRILHEKPVPPHQVRASIPLKLSELLLKALEKEPKNRPFDALTLARSLRPFGGFEPRDSSVVRAKSRGGPADSASPWGSTLDGATTELTASIAATLAYGRAAWSRGAMTALLALMVMVADSVAETVRDVAVQRPPITSPAVAKNAPSPEAEPRHSTVPPVARSSVPLVNTGSERTKAVARSPTRPTASSVPPAEPSAAAHYGVFSAPSYESSNPYR